MIVQGKGKGMFVSKFNIRKFLLDRPEVLDSQQRIVEEVLLYNTAYAYLLTRDMHLGKL